MAKDIFDAEGITPDPREEGGFFSDYVKPALNYEAGLGLGMGEGLVNALSSVGNLIPEAYEAVSGDKVGRIPKVDLMQYAPEGNAAKIGGMIGNPIGSLGAPGGAIMKGVSKAPLISKLPQALKSIMGGAAAGGALSEGDRGFGAEVGAGLGGIGSAVAGLSKALGGSDLTKEVQLLQSQYESKNKSLGSVFDHVENEVEKRGLPPVNIDHDLIDRAKTFLPKTEANSQLIDRAKTGDFKALRDLQSDLRVEAQDALASELRADKHAGREALEVRNKINKNLSSHLQEFGHKDLADALKIATEGYKKLNDTYFANNALAKIFGKGKEIPRKPLTTFTVNNKYINEFKEAHPEFKKALELALKNEKIKKLGKAGGALLGIGGGSEAVQFVINHFRHNN